MLDRPRSAAAIRARERRARRRAGIVRDLRVRVPTKRLVAALRLANSQLPNGELSTEAIEAELQSVILAFVQRWLDKKPHA
jgi:hypothetical protein